jgi:hypothetical protein
MAIIGESFDKWVQKQIGIRQQKLSLQDNRDNDTLKYITNKTSFLRLTSGINVSENKCKELGYTNYNGNQLAKTYTLFSTRFPVIDNAQSEFTTDIGYTSNIKSYGFSSDTDYGLVPPPGIISADIKSLNRGSLREAKINVVCHNLLQFKIISALFLRLRYSLLLEWGHTLYFDNNENLQSKFAIPNLSDDFINSKFTYGYDNSGSPLVGNDQEALLKAIALKRKESSGNYDAFFGVIKNFNWELMDNGSYNITIDAISTGDVIESLKVNTSFPLPSKTDVSVYSKPNDDSSNKSIYDKSTIHRILGDIKSQIIWNGGYLHGFKQNVTDRTLDTTTVSAFTKYIYNFKRPGDNQNITFPNNDLTWNEGFRIFFSNLEIDEDNKQPIEQYYIKLGALLRILESFILYYDKTKKSTPVFFLDHNYNDNYCLTTPLQISSDPRVCLIPLSYDNGTVFELTQPYTKITRVYTLYYDRTTDSLRWQYLNTPTEVTYESLQDIGTETLNQEKIATGNFVRKFDVQNVPPFLQAAVQGTSNIYVQSLISYAGQSVQGGGSGLPLIIGVPQSPEIKQAIMQIATVEFVDTKSSRTNYNLSILGNQIGGDDLFRNTDNALLGKTMHIQVNISYIISVLDDNIDSDGNLSVLDFLSNLMDGIKKSLGYINDFEIVHNSDNNTYYIIDNASLPQKYNKINNISKFNINLLKDKTNSGGSFVTNFGLKSELFAKIANTIALGAQANGNTVISNSTAFSEFNIGLIDRILTEKTNVNSNSSTSVASKFIDSFQLYIDYRTKLSALSLSKDDVSFFESFIKDIYQYELGGYTEANNMPGTGFIPLNLHLTMDGLSGMKIYETFDIDDTLLPSEYKNRIRFIIRGVNHKIDSKGWETNIETLSIPRATKLNILTPSSLTTSTTNIGTAQNQDTSFVASDPSAKQAAEKYLGRTMTDKEWNELVAATYAESSRNTQERGWVAAVMLNRAIKGNKSITEVLYARSQFQSVTGTVSNGNRASINYINGPDSTQSQDIYKAIKTITIDVEHDYTKFTSNIPAAYGAGTNIQYMYDLRKTGRVIGKTVFSK